MLAVVGSACVAFGCREYQWLTRACRASGLSTPPRLGAPRDSVLTTLEALPGAQARLLWRRLAGDDLFADREGEQA